MAHLPERFSNLAQLVNEPIPHAHVAPIEEYVAREEPILIGYLDELEALSRKLAKKTRAADRRKRELRACQRILKLSRSTSILKLPPEILALIFHYSIPISLTSCFKHVSNYYRNPPFTLVQVCRKWRAIATEIPSLWTFFSIRSLHTDGLRSGPGFAGAMNSYFERTGKLGRSVDLYLEGDYEIPHLPSVAFGSSFRPNYDLKYISVGAPDLDYLLRSITKGWSPGSSLWNPSVSSYKVESLVLYSKHAPETMYEVDPDPISIFSRDDFKSLQRLSLCTGTKANPALLDIYRLPWERLTHVAITSWIPDHSWWDMFSELTGLQKGIFYVKLYNAFDLDNVPDPEDVEEHPNLTDLTLIVKNFTANIVPLPFSLPSLTHIRLGAYDYKLRDDAMFDLRGVPGSGLTNLTSLSLYHQTWQIPASHITDIFGLTPNLRCLTLGVWTDYNEVFDALNLGTGHDLTSSSSSSDPDSDSHHILLPSLEEVVLDYAPSQYETMPIPKTSRPLQFLFDADDFAEMVESRWKGGLVESGRVSQLKKASIFLWDRHSSSLDELKENLDDVVAEGFTLTTCLTKSPRTWEDPLERNITHWHEGLVLAEKSDCAVCLRESIFGIPE
jgi:hypothetical protein